MLKDLAEFFTLTKKINYFVNQNFKIVFYSENKTYQKYSKILLDYLINSYPKLLFLKWLYSRNYF